MSTNRRISNKAFWWKLSLLVLAVMLNVALASRIVWGSHSLYTWRVLKEKQSELSEELAALDEKRAELSREIRLLKTDRLNYVRKNEILYLFDKSRENSAWLEAGTDSKHE